MQPVYVFLISLSALCLYCLKSNKSCITWQFLLHNVGMADFLGVNVHSASRCTEGAASDDVSFTNDVMVNCVDELEGQR